jgi:hypothetical protein
VDSRRDIAARRARLAELRRRYGRKSPPLIVHKTLMNPPRTTSNDVLIAERAEQLQRTIAVLRRRLAQLKRRR